MDNYKLTLGIEPTNKYEKAKLDLFQALKSYSELSPSEQQILAEELFGITKIYITIDMFNRCFGKLDL